MMDVIWTLNIISRICQRHETYQDKGPAQCPCSPELHKNREEEFLDNADADPEQKNCGYI